MLLFGSRQQNKEKAQSRNSRDWAIFEAGNLKGLGA
jgi:hypothetical protein